MSLFSAFYRERVTDEVRRALVASDEEREAATKMTRLLMQMADAEDEDGPLIHGWGPHAAFLAGVVWERKRKEG
jgi:hypothetical protein